MLINNFNYFYVSEGDAASGVTKKVVSQLNALHQLGIPCSIVSNNNYFSEFNHIKKFADFRIPRVNRKRDAIQYYKSVARMLEYAVSRSENNDVIYVRGVPFTFWDLCVLRKPRNCKIVCEVQSLTLKERPLCFSSIMERLFRRSIRKHVDAFVCVTDEIRDYEQQLFPDKTPSMCLHNGIDVNAMPLRTPPVSSDSINILSVARFNKWHGVERLLPLLTSGKQSLILDLVGYGPGMLAIQKEVERLRIKNKCIIHGQLHGMALDKLFSQTHLAAGALAIHKVGLKECASLKHREYCARGIPFMYAGEDPDFSEDFLFARRVPLGDAPIPFEEVLDFCKIIRSRPDHPRFMRNYAAQNLDWKTKMCQLVGFLQKL